MYIMLNQNVTWFKKKFKLNKLGVRRSKIPQVQVMFHPAVQVPHTLRSHVCYADQISSMVMDEIFTSIYVQYFFLKITGQCSSLPLLVNLSLVSAVRRGKSENGYSAA